MSNEIDLPVLPSIEEFTNAPKNDAHSEASVEEFTSTQATIIFDKVIRLTELQFVYGIFSFKHSKDAKSYILSGLYYEGVKQKLTSGGYLKRYTSPTESIYIQQKGSIISEVSTEQMRDYLTAYVETFDKDLEFEFEDVEYTIPFEALRETYLKNSNNIFNKVWLEHLNIHNVPVLKDTEKEIFLFFKNTLVVIAPDKIETRPWSDVSGFCIWENQMIKHDHDFEFIQDYEDSKFYKFISNVNNRIPERVLAMGSAIGYLIHHHFNPSEGQAVILYDEAVADLKNPQGGTGKGLIANAIKQVRDVGKVDGKHFDGKNKFKFENVSPSTQVVWIDDIKPDFDFSLLYSNLTDGWTIERKYLSQFLIPPEDSPKTMICSNTIIKNAGVSTVRREFEYELSDHYSKKIINGDEKPIVEEHGGLFFSKEWTKDEWNKFFSFICDCGKIYLASGIVLQQGINVKLNRLIQTTGNSDDFVKWCDSEKFQLNELYKTADKFSEFKNVYYPDDNTFKQRRFTEWLKNYAKYRGWAWERVGDSKDPSFRFIEKTVKK